MSYDHMVYRARVLSSLTRLDVWSCVASGPPMHPTDIATTLGLAPSTVSHHLRVLEEAGLVRHRKLGRYRLYEWTATCWGVLSPEEAVELAASEGNV